MDKQFHGFYPPNARTKYYYDDPTLESKHKPRCSQWTYLMKLVLMSKYNDVITKIKNILLIDPEQINLKNKHGWSPLLLACRWVNVYVAPECLKILIDAGANVNERCINRETCLIKLLQSCAPIEYFIMLLKYGADSNLCDNFNNTLLHKCAECLNYSSDTYCFETANILIKYGADVNKQNFSLDTPLMIIAKNKYSVVNEKFLNLLLKNGADINKQNEDGYTALMINCLCRNNDCYFIETVSKFKPDINLVDNDGNSAIHIICNNNYFGIDKLKRLLELGADANIQNTHTKNTPLAYIFERSQCLKKAKLLIDHGANLNICIKNGIPLLHGVIYNCVHDDIWITQKDTSTIKFLIDNNIDVDITHNNETILIKLCKEKKIQNLPIEIVSLLVKISNLRALDDNGLTAYDYFISYKIDTHYYAMNAEKILELLCPDNDIKSARKT